MELPVCWLFFDGVLLPGDPAAFAGHCHDLEYIGDCPANGYLVPCDVCMVDQTAHILSYNTAIAPPDQSGVIVTPLNPLRIALAIEPLEQKFEPPRSAARAIPRRARKPQPISTYESEDFESIIVDEYGNPVSD